MFGGLWIQGFVETSIFLRPEICLKPRENNILCTSKLECSVQIGLNAKVALCLRNEMKYKSNPLSSCSEFQSKGLGFYCQGLERPSPALVQYFQVPEFRTSHHDPATALTMLLLLFFQPIHRHNTLVTRCKQHTETGFQGEDLLESGS